MKKLVIATLALVSFISVNAFAVDVIDREKAQTMQYVATASLSGVGDSPSAIDKKMAEKAKELGATAYVVINNQSNNSWNQTAEFYR